MAQDGLLQGRERCQNTLYFPPGPNGRQDDVVEGRQQAFGGRLAGGAFGLARLQAGQAAAGLLDAKRLAGLVFHDRQDPRAQGEQMRQAHGMIFPADPDRAQRQRAAFDVGTVAPHQPLVTVSRHGLRQGQRGLGDIGDMRPPTLPESICAPPISARIDGGLASEDCRLVSR
jgi:hypothetical protein